MHAIKYAKRTADYGDYVGANNVLETVLQQIVEDRVIAQDEIIRKAYAGVSAQVKAGLAIRAEEAPRLFRFWGEK
jgi:hypothetical protein